MDPVSEPKSSSTTSDSDSLTLLIDTLLAPSAESEDFVGDWIYVRSQPIAVDSAADINEGGQFSASDVTLTVDDGTKFTVGDGIQFSATATATGEICRVTAIATNDLTVVRGIQGTTATTHEDSDNVFLIGPAIGEIARVTAVDFSGSTSSLTLAPGFSASLIGGAEYERHRKVRPNIINDRLDVILGLLRQNVLLPVTVIEDGDMETSGVGNWTAALVTLTKDTTFVRHGRFSLKILATASGGSAISEKILLPPGTVCIVETDVYITRGDSFKIQFFNSGNTVIGTAMESDESGWVHLEGLFTVPVGSTYQDIRLFAQTDTDVIYVDHVTVWPILDKGIDLPSHLEFLFDVESLFFYPVGTGIAGSTNVNAYRINEGAPQFYAHSQKELDDTGVGASRFYVPSRLPTNALWIKGRKPYPVFAGATDALKDADTTQANRYVVTNMTAASIIDDLALDAIEAEKFELARKLTERALLLRFEINHIMANMTPPNKLITTPFTRKRV